MFGPNKLFGPDTTLETENYIGPKTILFFQPLKGPATLHELPADRDGGDGLLPGEVPPVWQDPPWQEDSS